MPFAIEERKTPKGQPVLVNRAMGYVSLKDAQDLGELLKPGQPHHQGLVLSIVDSDVTYNPEARRFFKTYNGNYKRMSIVVTSVVMRATINFMSRVAGNLATYRMFNDEKEALAWLDD